jgi:hypothetical protein
VLPCEPTELATLPRDHGATRGLPVEPPRYVGMIRRASRRTVASVLPPSVAFSGGQSPTGPEPRVPGRRRTMDQGVGFNGPTVLRSSRVLPGERA